MRSMSKTQASDAAHGANKPPLSQILAAKDFAVVASKTASPKTWAFYSSADGDQITRDANKAFFNRIWFRPRVMRNMSNVNLEAHVLGVNSDAPLFVSPAGLVQMIHPEGELGIARACQNHGIVQVVSNNASYSIQDIVAAAPNGRYAFQLYFNRDRSAMESILKQCSEIPQVSAILLTLDAAWPGKREADERIHVDENLSAPMVQVKGKNDEQGGGIARLLGNYIDSSLNWEDLEWVRQRTHLPVILKGIMTAEDAILAMNANVDGILISNHGGRNLDSSPPSLLVLLELHKRCPEIFSRMPVYLDGGVTRGTDILKALALGASAVGLGRTVLYAANYGQSGVHRLLDIYKRELSTAMANTGVASIDEINPDVVNTHDLDYMVPGPSYVQNVVRPVPKQPVKPKL